MIRPVKPFGLTITFALFLCSKGLLISDLHAQETTSDSNPATWHEKMEVNGDFRFRWEGYFKENQATRHRERFRLRLNMGTVITDELDFGVRLSSGDPGNPGSGNQPMGEFFTRKTLNIDRAFLSYTPKAVPSVTLGGGKFGYPLTRTEMIWDNDINWEGTYQHLSIDNGGPATFKLTAVQSPLNEIKRSNDSFLFAQAAEINFGLGKHSLKLALTNYTFREIDQVALASEAKELRTHNTNLLRRDREGFKVIGFLSDFNLVDVIAGVTFDTGNPDYPVSILGDWVTNTRAATEDDTGIWVTSQYGRANAPGTFSISYTFAHIEQEAVVSNFAFSEMPGSNLRLHMPKFSLSIKKGLKFNLEGFISKSILSDTPDQERWLKRIHTALLLSF